MRFPGLVVSLSVCTLACAPNPKAPANVMALVPTVKGNFSPFETQLTTVTDVTALKGSVLTIKGGARVRIDPNDPALANAATDDQIRTALLKDPGGDVHVNYVDKSGVLWPADFHSWMLVTTYLNFERANAYYTSIFDGKPTDDLLGTTVDYWASFTDLSSGGEDKPATDNALYFSPVKSFLILPFDGQSGPGCDKSAMGCSAFDLIPLPMNPGVIGHEYGHLVFSHRVYGNAAVPAPLSMWSLAPFNVLKSIDEGFSDYHGFGVTCLTAAGCRYFLPWSIDSATLLDSRDFTDSSDKKCMSTDLRNAIQMLDNSQFLGQSLQYQTGTLFAVAMYQAGEKLGKRDLMQKALVASYDDASVSTPGLKQIINENLNTPANFTLEKVVDAIAAHITDPQLLKEFCAEAANRLQLVCDGQGTPASGAPCGFLPHCGNQWAANTTCPTLGP